MTEHVPPTVVVSTAAASDAQRALARAALRSQRQRMIELLHDLDGDSWKAQSRCSAWTVHQVARHLCDATLRGTALLRGELPEDAVHFDPRTTPLAWLEHSAGEQPSDTVRTFTAASAELIDQVDRLSDTDDRRVPFLYGSVPSSIAVLHVFWDAWVHERDITAPLGQPHRSPAVESRAAAMYGLTVANVLPLLRGAELEQALVLTGPGGGAFTVRVGDGMITTTAHDSDATGDAGPEQLRGDLPCVIDSMAGRGPELDDVLSGPAERVGRLATLRAFMLTPVA